MKRTADSPVRSGGRGLNPRTRFIATSEEATRVHLVRIDQVWRAGYRLLLLENAADNPDLGILARHIASRGLASGVSGACHGLLESMDLLVEEGNLRHVNAEFWGVKHHHDTIGGHGAFDATMEFLTCLRERGIECVATCVVTEAGLNGLESLVQTLLALEGVVIHLAAHPAEDFAWLGPAERALLKGLVSKEGVWHEGFPHCVLSPATGNRSPAVVNDYFGERVHPDTIERVRLKPPECAGCVEHLSCCGITVASYGRGGAQALRPIKITGPSQGGSFRGVPVSGLSGASPYRPEESSRLDIAPRYPDTALLTLIVPGCDLQCIFCTTPQGESSLMSSSPTGVVASLYAMREKTDGVFFTGGEPTQLPWLVDTLRVAKALGYERIQMQTHAGRAADMALAQQWVDAGLTAVDVPLYGDNARTHQVITQTKGSFARTVKGLENFKALGLATVVHVTLFRANMHRIEELLRFVDSLSPDAAYIQTTGEVGPAGTYQEVAPHPHEVAQRLMDAFEHYEPRTPVGLADLPPCLLPGLQDRVIRWNGTVTRNAAALVMPYSDWLMTFRGGDGRGYGAPCAECGLRQQCEGLPQEALAHFGHDYLQAQ